MLRPGFCAMKEKAIKCWGRQFLLKRKWCAQPGASVSAVLIRSYTWKVARKDGIRAMDWKFKQSIRGCGSGGSETWRLIGIHGRESRWEKGSISPIAGEPASPKPAWNAQKKPRFLRKWNGPTSRRAAWQEPGLVWADGWYRSWRFAAARWNFPAAGGAMPMQSAATVKYACRKNAEASRSRRRRCMESKGRWLQQFIWPITFLPMRSVSMELGAFGK